MHLLALCHKLLILQLSTNKAEKASSVNTAVAYIVGFLFLGAVGGLLGSLIGVVGLLLGVKKPTTWSFSAGLVGAILSYWLVNYFFQWLNVQLTWYAYLISMVLVVLNDGRRAAPEGKEAIGIESSHARGTMCGIIASLVTHFMR